MEKIGEVVEEVVEAVFTASEVAEESDRDISGFEVMEKEAGGGEEGLFGGVGQRFRGEDGVKAAEIVADEVFHILFTMAASEKAREVLVSDS